MNTFVKKVIAAVRGEKPAAAFFASRDPYCMGCNKELPIYKIGNYTYHRYGHGVDMGCSIADAALKKDKK